MVTFRNLWDGVYNTLVASATDLGVTADKIRKGSPFQKMPRQAPYIYVYCLPGDGDDNRSGIPSNPMADISIFCAVEIKESPEESLIGCVELAGNIIKVLATYIPITYEEQGIEIDPNSSQTTAVLIYKGRYDYA